MVAYLESASLRDRLASQWMTILKEGSFEVASLEVARLEITNREYFCSGKLWKYII